MKTMVPLPFLYHVSSEYLEQLEQDYLQNPKSVPPDWAFFFGVLHFGQELVSERTKNISEEYSGVEDELKVMNLISAYRMRGHLLAELDPLGLKKLPFNPRLDLPHFKLENIPLDRIFQAATELGLPPSPLSQILEHLKETYCHYIGVEYFYIRDEKIYRWLKEHIDHNRNKPKFSSEQKIRILKHLYQATGFESFLQKNYTGQKRFSLEGGESLIPALKETLEVVAQFGAEEVVIGMAHRGRLNVLANILQKPHEEIFKEFEGAELPELEATTGDVKYHQGFSSDILTTGGKQIHLSLAPNPSHLEFVNPIVEGVTRAKQDAKYEKNTSKVVPILIHGDASVIGQGIVAETLNLSQLQGYKTGGTIHIVINNQVGFTTSPEESRSTLYCSDPGKGFQCPMFHVNGDDVEAVVHVMQLAAEFRIIHKKDVFIDIVCYRKYGHNEGDEPRFTQPLMYEKIKSHPSPFEIYLKKLAQEKLIDHSHLEKPSKEFEETLFQKREKIKNSKKILSADMFGGLWSGLERPNTKKLWEPVNTRIQEEHFKKIIETIHHAPTHLHPLPKLQKLLEERLKFITQADKIDWALGEQLALGSLLLEGFPVRLTGQDSIRGTFSHRHASIVDQQTEKVYFPLNHLASSQAPLMIYNSPLSEAGVLGFEYGYSLANPKTLVLWEAQFGDFANGAQVIMDQFISSGEAKWYRMSGLVILLPHGYEGQGPEHSSARLERYLQLCAQHNMQVTYPTTPVQYAHLLRRQVHRKFRRPLIIMTPKSPLRMPEVVSAKKDFVQGEFKPVLVDPIHDKNKIERVLCCSGKIYWELKQKAHETQIENKNVFVRVEQLYPLDKEALKKLHVTFKTIPWCWVQEESQNMGAWSFMKLMTLELGINLQYVGRPPSASPATGSSLNHAREQQMVLQQALGLS